VRGQALVELALCAPVILVLALGTVAAVQVLEAESGLQAATGAALGAAVRAPDAASAIAAARSSFVSVIATYPLRSPSIAVAVGTFARGSLVSVDATAMVDASGAHIALHVHSALRVERWRSRP
jgi:Flp pilus assembly protein TadG